MAVPYPVSHPTSTVSYPVSYPSCLCTLILKQSVWPQTSLCSVHLKLKTKGLSGDIWIPLYFISGFILGFMPYSGKLQLHTPNKAAVYVGDLERTREIIYKKDIYIYIYIYMCVYIYIYIYMCVLLPPGSLGPIFYLPAHRSFRSPAPNAECGPSPPAMWYDITHNVIYTT